jgi:hypothetical protein
MFAESYTNLDKHIPAKMNQQEEKRTVIDQDFAPDVLCMRYRDIKKITESE